MHDAEQQVHSEAICLIIDRIMHHFISPLC